MAHDDALPTVDELHAVHKKIVDKYGIDSGTREDNVDGVIQRILDEVKKYDDDDEYETAARLLSRFVSRGPYTAGNKATGWLITTVYLSRAGASIDPDVLKMAPYVVRNTGRYPRKELAEWLRTGTINTDPFEEEASAA